MYKKLENRIAEILKLELGQGDIVEHKGFQRRYIVHKITKTRIDLIGKRFYSNDSTILELVLPISYKDLKLIRRNITLSMVLEAFNYVRKFHTHLDINSKGYLTYWESDNDDSTIQVDWILGKSLYDQKNEKLYKFLFEVLKAGE